MEFNSATCSMASEKIVTGAKHFELSKTDAGGPRYEICTFVQIAVLKLSDVGKG